MRTRIVWISLVVALIAGCGGGGEEVAPDTDNSAERFSGDRGRAAQVVEDFSAAVAAGDWSRICDELYTRKQARLTAGILGDTCESEVEQTYAENRELYLTVKFVRSDEFGVTVFSRDDEGNDQAFNVEDEGGEWRIDGFGGTFGADG